MREVELVELLKEKKYKIATAESCTGGLLAATIINVPSASSVIDYSFVTYSCDAKTKLVSVSNSTISSYNVVSEEVAREMALGVTKYGAEVGVGITGLAGPGGGTDEIPVGKVCFAICIKGEITSFSIVFKGERNEIRSKAVDYAIEKLIYALKNAK